PAPAPGRCPGRPNYRPPEQGHDPRTADPRADLYSLGCTLYFLLTGAPPFGGEAGNLRKMKAHAEAPVPDVRRARPDVPDGVATVLRRLLAKDPAQRYQTPAEVAAALRPFCDRTGPPRARRRRPGVAAAL